jgi:uncharacterized membrane protein
MGSTILLVIALVVLWVVVLVPLILRWRETGTTSNRSVERFSSSMRVLARRTAAPADSETADDATDIADGEYSAHAGAADDLHDDAHGDARDEVEYDEHVAAADNEHHLAAVDGDTDANDDTDDEPPADLVRPLPSGRKVMLERRRRSLGTLVTAGLISLILALSWLPVMWVVQLACDVLLVGYLVWLRAEAKREQQRRARRAARLARGERVARTVGRETREAALRTLPRRPARASVSEVDGDVDPTAETEEIDAAAVRRAAAGDADRRWQPRPVPTPTYVDAPPARRRTAALDDSIGVVALDDSDLEFVDADDLDYAEDVPGSGQEIYRPRAVGD